MRGARRGRCPMSPEPPANGGYMTAAYIVAAVIYLGYSFLL